MNSYWSRLSQLTSIYVFGLLFCGFYTYLGGKVQEWSTPGSKHDATIQKVDVDRFGTHAYYHSDVAKLVLSLDADLSPAFTWSTDVLFAYVTVYYSTEYRPRNEVIVWDRIISSKEDARVHLEEDLSKYLFQDYSKGHLHDKQITAKLHYYQMPKTGFFHKYVAGSPVAFQMPSNYTVKGRIRP